MVKDHVFDKLGELADRLNRKTKQTDTHLKGSVDLNSILLLWAGLPNTGCDGLPSLKSSSLDRPGQPVTQTDIQTDRQTDRRTDVETYLKGSVDLNSILLLWAGLPNTGCDGLPSLKSSSLDKPGQLAALLLRQTDGWTDGRMDTQTERQVYKHPP